MSPDGTILRCDLRGVILEIVADGLHIADLFAVGRQLDQVVAETEINLARDLIVTTRRDGVAFDRLLAVDRHDERSPMRFDGSRIDDQLLITVRTLARSGFGLSHAVLDAMGALNNRLVTRQRALARALADVTRLTSAVQTPPPIIDDTAVISPAERFTDREREVLAMLLMGLPNREIGRLLTIEVSAVKARLRAIYRKMGVSNRAQVVLALANTLPVHKKK